MKSYFIADTHVEKTIEAQKDPRLLPKVKKVIPEIDITAIITIEITSVSKNWAQY